MAFDRFWHNGLIRKLYAIGVRGTLLTWFKDYLTNRTQAVVIKGKTSPYLTIPSGVPQGSVLGPLLFLIYMNDIVIDIEAIIKLFADDTSIYLSIDEPDRRSLILNSDLLKITNWAKKWKVSFNPSKTELMTICNKRDTQTAAEWNNLEDKIKQANSITQFKRMLAFNDVKVPKLYYSENRTTEIIHCKIRLQISDLNNHLFQRYLRADSICNCGFRNENSKHYFFDCPTYTEARMLTIETIPNFTSLRLESLTHGDNSKTYEENRFVFDKVQQFITLSNRFN